jgi:hypothetical protein
MGFNAARLSRRAKTSSLLLVLVVAGFGVKSFFTKDSGCPNRTSKWVALGYPQSSAKDVAITAFVLKEQLLSDLEDWAGDLQCSGNGQLLGRVLAEMTQSEDSLNLSTVFLGAAAKGPKVPGSKASAELRDIFSSPAALDAFPESIVADLSKQVEAKSKSFQKALYEIILQSLPPETAGDFRSQTRLAETFRRIK